MGLAQGSGGRAARYTEIEKLAACKSIHLSQKKMGRAPQQATPHLRLEL